MSFEHAVNCPVASSEGADLPSNNVQVAVRKGHCQQSRAACFAVQRPALSHITFNSVVTLSRSPPGHHLPLLVQLASRTARTSRHRDCLGSAKDQGIPWLGCWLFIIGKRRITALWQSLSLAEREAACRPGDCGFLKYDHAQPETLEPCGIWKACVKGVG